jgi:hypothetical protein
MTDPTSVFPHPELSPHQGKPNHGSLKLIHKELNANAKSVISNRGNGETGYLDQTISAAKYFLLTGQQPPAPPVHPGANPAPAVNPAGGNPTQAMITEALRLHVEAIRVHTEYHQVHAKLKQLLLARIPPIYIAIFDDPDYGFSEVSLLELLTFLDTEHGVISPADLTANEEELKSPWSTTDPIDVLWAKTTRCHLFDLTIPPAKLVRDTLTILEKTGVFTDDVKHWNRRPAAEQTFENLKTAFNMANAERLLSTTTENAGYHGAHHAAGAAVPMFYCWTHGLGPESQHTSATCTRPTANHNQLATADNMLGGNRSIRPKRGEVRIHVPLQRPNRNPRNPPPPAAEG